MGRLGEVSSLTATVPKEVLPLRHRRKKCMANTLSGTFFAGSQQFQFAIKQPAGTQQFAIAVDKIPSSTTQNLLFVFFLQRTGIINTP